MDRKKTTCHAVALRYDPKKDAAPRVLAKGAGYIAEKIIQAARQHGIPLVCDPVAGDLLSRADPGTEIPTEFYQAVAEILAFVYHLNSRVDPTENGSSKDDRFDGGSWDRR